MTENIVKTLSHDILLKIFSELSAEDRKSLAYVCKAWATLLKSSGELYSDLFIDLSHIRTDEVTNLFSWLRPRIGFTRRLELDLPNCININKVPYPTVSGILMLCADHNCLQTLLITSGTSFLCPVEVSCVDSITRLELRGKQTYAPLPAELGHLSNLRSLHIDTEIVGGHRVVASFFPTDLLWLTQLTELSLASCGELKIPLTVYELSCMQTLSIRHCRAVHFAEGNYMATSNVVSSLKSLTLADCNLHRLPYQVGSLDNLEVLDLRGNKLASLPAIGLQKLQRLQLADNNFKQLPRLLYRLPALKHLDLSNNPCLEVYESEVEVDKPYMIRRNLMNLVGMLTSLEVLDLRQSQDKVWSAESLDQLWQVQAHMAAARQDHTKKAALKSLLL